MPKPYTESPVTGSRTPTGPRTSSTAFSWPRPKKVPALQAHENPLGWLLRALNYELSHEFARQAKQTAQEQPLHPSPAGLAPTPPPSLGLAEVLPVQLSPRDREILLLFYEEGLSYQEIAQRLGVPVSTCGTWLSRARKHCRAYLSHSPGFPD